jgi:hypothetical protein
MEQEYAGHKNTKLHGMYFMFINSLLVQIYYNNTVAIQSCHQKKKKNG